MQLGAGVGTRCTRTSQGRWEAGATRTAECPMARPPPPLPCWWACCVGTLRVGKRDMQCPAGAGRLLARRVVRHPPPPTAQPVPCRAMCLVASPRAASPGPQVLEETGYDIRPGVDHTNFVEMWSDGKKHKLYIVAGLDPTTQEFEPHSKFVSCCSCRACLPGGDGAAAGVRSGGGVGVGVGAPTVSASAFAWLFQVWDGGHGSGQARQPLPQRPEPQPCRQVLTSMPICV